MIINAIFQMMHLKTRPNLRKKRKLARQQVKMMMMIMRIMGMVMMTLIMGMMKMMMMIMIMGTMMIVNMANVLI